MMNSTSRLRGRHSTIASAGTGIDQAPPSPLQFVFAALKLVQWIRRTPAGPAE